MKPKHRHPLVSSFILTVMITCLIPQAYSSAAEKERIDAAIAKGKGFLLKQKLTGPEGSLACYALVKCGVEKDHPQIASVIAEIIAKCPSTGYRPRQHHRYEAAVDVMLLEAIDPVQYLPQIKLIADYLIAAQNTNGAWFYEAENQPTFGDTSITQYGVLGLWAAARAGVDVPSEVWGKAARWLIDSQRTDGGFAYHPFLRVGVPNDQSSTSTMTSAGAGSLLICRLMLGGTSERSVPSAEAQSSNETKKKFGVLERYVDDQEAGKNKRNQNTRSDANVSVKAIDSAVKPAVNWVGDHFLEKSKSYERFTTYYYYGIERLAALLNVDKIGQHDWYEEGSTALLLLQRNDGDWVGDNYGSVSGTSLSLLFLSKATASVITRPKPIAKIGGGVLIGGRGIGGSNTNAKLGEVLSNKPKNRNSIDQLLSELEQSTDSNIESLQTAVVETVQLDRREELVGQVNRLKALANDKRSDVRQTVMWALGRSGDITAGQILIRGLSDIDEAVIREASIALGILSRRPQGCGLPIDPTEGLKDGATDEERLSYIETWSKTSTQRWMQWYLHIRPYDEQSDLHSLKNRNLP